MSNQLPSEDSLRGWVIGQIKEDLEALGFEVYTESVTQPKESAFPVDVIVEARKAIGFQFKRPLSAINDVFRFRLDPQQHLTLNRYPPRWFYYAFPCLHDYYEQHSALCRTIFSKPHKISVHSSQTIELKTNPNVIQSKPFICCDRFPNLIYIGRLLYCYRCPVRNRCFLLSPCQSFLIHSVPSIIRLENTVWPILRCAFLSCYSGVDASILKDVRDYVWQNREERFAFILIMKDGISINIYLVNGEPFVWERRE